MRTAQQILREALDSEELKDSIVNVYSSIENLFKIVSPIVVDTLKAALADSNDSLPVSNNVSPEVDFIAPAAVSTVEFIKAYQTDQKQLTLHNISIWLAEAGYDTEIRNRAMANKVEYSKQLYAEANAVMDKTTTLFDLDSSSEDIKGSKGIEVAKITKEQREAIKESIYANAKFDPKAGEWNSNPLSNNPK